MGRTMTASEIHFEVSGDELDRGYLATVLGFGIHTKGDTTEDLHQSVGEVVDCHINEVMERPNPIRLHFVRDVVPVT